MTVYPQGLDGPLNISEDPKSGVLQLTLHENINDYNSKVKVFHSDFKCVDRGAMLALSDLQRNRGVRDQGSAETEKRRDILS
jgi:hypothetical protein